LKLTYIKLSKNQNKMDKKGGRRYLDRKGKNKIVNVNSEERFLNKSHRNIEESYRIEDRKERAKKILSKNQVALYAISLMLITSGYFNYTNNLKTASLGDAQLVNSNIVDESEITNEASTEFNRTNEIELKENNEVSAIIEENNKVEIGKNQSEETSSKVNSTEQIINTVDNDNVTGQVNNDSIKETSNEVESKEYFTQTKLERDKMYSQMIETYEKILENNNISTEQKNTASEEIKNINNKRNGIATSETLIKAKGIEEIVIIVNSDVIDAIVKAEDNLNQEKVAQISNIISRELGAGIENIHITTHK